jgi:hypothetical protein
VVGAPIDPFLPLVAAVALRRSWPASARLVAGVSLGPLTAIACGDLVAERTALYLVLSLAALHTRNVMRDGVAVRTALVAVALAAMMLVRTLLALGGSFPEPAEGLGVLAASVAWTALHATVCIGVERRFGGSVAAEGAA